MVSAEGIHSKLRQACFSDEETIVDHNIVNWRFIVDYPNHNMQPTYHFAGSEMFMSYPLSPDSLYCYAHVYDASGKYSTGDPQQHLSDLFGKFGGAVPDILACIGDTKILLANKDYREKYTTHC